ncbi:hypothetical protein [Helicobacter macacae]|uniref:Uncharacterized protein n=1 Tax=Helicobacter macacae MIT 99-5501 TaxID=1357400 RepID=V8CC51_9HELI|nr:hypothetical protein [Helicobacter macacae]ETD24677.1 hypothetical protein HMPREF2086_00009 [Helicobacter macacae MIT 99-5501]
MSNANNTNRVSIDAHYTNTTKSFLLDFASVLTKEAKALLRNLTKVLKRVFVPLCAIFAGPNLQGCFDIKIKTQTPSVGYYSLPSVVAPKDCPSFLPMRLEVEVASEFNTTNIFIEGKNGRIEPLKDAQWLDLPSNLIKTSLEAKAQSQCIALSSTNIDSKIPLLQVRVFSFGIAQNQEKEQDKENLSASVNMSLRLSQAQASTASNAPSSTQTKSKERKKGELNSNIHTKVEVAQNSTKSSDEQILAIKNALDKALDESIERVNEALKKD